MRLAYIKNKIWEHYGVGERTFVFSYFMQKLGWKLQSVWESFRGKLWNYFNKR